MAFRDILHSVPSPIGHSIGGLIAILLWLTSMGVNVRAQAGPGGQTAADSQQISFEQWDSAQGLPNSSVQTIAQTRDGYLWLGTQEGLVRFDGVRFVAFDQGNTPEIKNKYIQSLIAGR
ncbi:MAG TPA: two-component regulator propeller domain-containing protein, partial [Blastocatellia bacterium]|nr:two-component regulator propeller domain-containing protein [Blastocatellia bacterium]